MAHPLNTTLEQRQYFISVSCTNRYLSNSVNRCCFYCKGHDPYQPKVMVVTLHRSPTARVTEFRRQFVNSRCRLAPRGVRHSATSRCYASAAPHPLSKTASSARSLSVRPFVLTKFDVLPRRLKI